MLLRLTDTYFTINYLVRIFMAKVGTKIPILGGSIRNMDSTFVQNS